MVTPPFFRSYQLPKCGRGSPADRTLICCNDDAALPVKHKQSDSTHKTTPVKWHSNTDMFSFSVSFFTFLKRKSAASLYSSMNIQFPFQSAAETWLLSLCLLLFHCGCAASVSSLDMLWARGGRGPKGNYCTKGAAHFLYKEAAHSWSTVLTSYDLMWFQTSGFCCTVS